MTLTQKEISTILGNSLDAAQTALQLAQAGKAKDARQCAKRAEADMQRAQGGSAAHAARRKKIASLLAQVSEILGDSPAPAPEAPTAAPETPVAPTAESIPAEADTAPTAPAPAKDKAPKAPKVKDPAALLEGVAADPALPTLNVTALREQHAAGLAALPARDKGRAELEAKLAILNAATAAQQADAPAYDAAVADLFRTVTNLRIHAHHAKGTDAHTALDARYRRYNDGLKDLKAGRLPAELAR